MFQNCTEFNFAVKFKSEPVIKLVTQLISVSVLFVIFPPFQAA